MKKHIYLSDLHFEHQTWKSEFEFQRNQLKTFRSRLEEVVPRYTNNDVLAEAEQFQNQMIRQNEVVDQLLHDIKIHEESLSTFAKDHPIAIDHVHFSDHTAFREKVDTQRKLYEEFKKGFLRFLTKYM